MTKEITMQELKNAIKQPKKEEISCPSNIANEKMQHHGYGESANY